MACCLFLTSCSNPLPPEKREYIGLWQGDGMYLLISAEGRVEYKRLRGGQTTSIEAPLQEFIGADFRVGVGFLSTTFKVEEPPHNLGGQWRMTVDGVQLVRTVESESSGPHPAQDNTRW